MNLNFGRFLDRAISPVAPGWAAARAAARIRYAAYQDHTRNVRKLRTYDAAEKSRHTADWETKNKSADQAIVGDYWTMLARARAACRDDWAGASAQFGYVRHVVGIGLTPKASVRDPYTGQLDEAFNRAADRLWKRWAHNPKWCDSEGKKSFVGCQRLAAMEEFATGEAFVLLAYTPRPETVGLTLQFFEPEQLDITLSVYGNNKVKAGIEVDDYGKALAYHVYLGVHPYEGRSTTSERIPAERVLHLIRQDRVRQTHGVTRYAPVLRDLWHTKMHKEYTLLRARFEACGGVALESEQGADPTQVLGMLTGSTDDAADTNLNPQFNLEPGFIWRMPHGVKLNFADPKVPGGTYEQFQKGQACHIAAGVGQDYPTLSRDYSGNTYSGQRQGMLEMWAETDPEQGRMVDQLCRPVRDVFITYAVLEGRLAPPDFADPELREEYLEASWRATPKYWIDPAREAAADKIQIEQRLTSRRDLLNEHNEDWRETFEEIEEERQEAARRGITLPEDQPKTGGIGAPNPGEARPTYQEGD